MRRSIVVSLLVIGVLVVLQTGAVQAAPSNGKHTEQFDVVCEGQTVAVISTGGNSSWTVDTSSGEASDTPAHLKELSVRIYEGTHTTEPSTDPVFAFEKTFGNRVGQGETTHCSGVRVHECPCGATETEFFDVEVTNADV